MEKIEIIKIKGEEAEKTIDKIVREIPLTIIVEKKELVTLLCSPDNLNELAVGFLFSSGLIKTMDQVKKITVNQQEWIVYLELSDVQDVEELLFKRVYTSGCGKGTMLYRLTDLINKTKSNGSLQSAFAIGVEKVYQFMSDFQKSSETFLQTGGVHSAAIADAEKIIVFREDIGRHNAVDKVIGYCILNNIELSDKLLLSSGRVSSEIVLKIVKADIPIVVSRSAATDQAVKLAKYYGVTLLGFVRGKRLNFYAGNRLKGFNLINGEVI